ncbi:uncharacterized protein A1O9_08151 [Exophiala aquamarina CBS 119918]|uniref:Uncharacterized protein n=1 Tax=Exophiala aquamarina CBS 119918 TaxID=1182545 RepID=A0A072P6C0_9EURO|nr:uncharacterized protein A1O9_08151 [Exophiala aquamarina CBS 119918]KEF55401.1 hypothetical protein A1O9_08151 [Exophiala aquamarina CBS 119918]
MQVFRIDIWSAPSLAGVLLPWMRNPRIHLSRSMESMRIFVPSTNFYPPGKWSDIIHQWEVMIRDLATGDIFTDTSHFFVEAAGRLNVPNFPGHPRV